MRGQARGLTRRKDKCSCPFLRFLQLRDLLPSLGMTAVMGLCVWAAGLLPLGNLPMLLTQAAVGVAVYGGLSLLLKPEAYRGMTDMLRALRRR